MRTQCCTAGFETIFKKDGSKSYKCYKCRKVCDIIEHEHIMKVPTVTKYHKHKLIEILNAMDQEYKGRVWETITDCIFEGKCIWEDADKIFQRVVNAFEGGGKPKEIMKRYNYIMRVLRESLREKTYESES